MIGFKLINTFNMGNRLDLCLADPEEQGIDALEQYCRLTLDLPKVELAFYSERQRAFLRPGKTFNEDMITEGDRIVLMKKPNNLEMEGGNSDAIAR